jgi:hypothetical protein
VHAFETMEEVWAHMDECTTYQCAWIDQWHRKTNQLLCYVMALCNVCDVHHFLSLIVLVKAHL